MSIYFHTCFLFSTEEFQLIAMPPKKHVSEVVIIMIITAHSQVLHLAVTDYKCPPLTTMQYIMPPSSLTHLLPATLG